MKPYALGAEQGEAIWMFDSLDTIKADAELRIVGPPPGTETLGSDAPLLAPPRRA
jgi:hypothetical protein